MVVAGTPSVHKRTGPPSYPVENRHKAIWQRLGTPSIATKPLPRDLSLLFSIAGSGRCSAKGTRGRVLRGVIRARPSSPTACCSSRLFSCLVGSEDNTQKTPLISAQGPSVQRLETTISRFHLLFSPADVSFLRRIHRAISPGSP